MRRWILLLAVMILGAMSIPAFGSELEELKAAVRQLQLRIDQAGVNLFWSVTNNVEAGIEYFWGRRITFANEEGIQHRINTMIQYNFF
jgi:hypothetical protein